MMKEKTLESQTGRKIHPLFLFLPALGLVIFIQWLLQWPVMTLSNKYDGEWFLATETGRERITLPYQEWLKETKTVTLSTRLPATKGMNFLFPQIKATAIKATLDGIIVYQIGGPEEPTANFWNNYLVIPLADSMEEDRTLTLEITGTQVITVNSQPFLEASLKVWRADALHRFFSNDLLLFFMGGSMLIGFLLISMTLHSDHLKMSSRLIGASSILITIWVFDFTFRTSIGPYWFYAFSKRLMLITGYFGVFLFTAGLDYYQTNKFNISRWAIVPTLCCMLASIAAPTVGRLYQWLPLMNGILIINLAMAIGLIYSKLRMYPLLLFSGFLGTLAFIQLTMVIIFQAAFPPILQYVVVFMSILFSLQFISQQRTIARERDVFKTTMERDSLTGAYNRRVFDKVHIDQFSAALFIDFDYFKYYNDKYGHDKGDSLLILFVSEAKKHLRPRDMLIRFGGDEFLILLKSVDIKIAIDIAERIRNEFKKQSGDPKVDISYGHSLIDSGNPFKLEEIDRKMYEMKEGKRNKRD